VRPKIDREHVRAGLNDDLLLVGEFVLVLGNEAEVAFARNDRRLPGIVIGDVCVRFILDVPREVLEYGCGLDIGIVVYRPHLDCGTILAHVIDDLRYVLIDFVQRKAGARAAGLRRVFAGGSNLRRPLIKRGKFQVEELELALLLVVVDATL